MNSCIFLCLDGDCEGCANEHKWCNDPRCYPYCSDCLPVIGEDRYYTHVIIAIVIILIIILILYYLETSFKIYHVY